MTDDLSHYMRTVGRLRDELATALAERDHYKMALERRPFARWRAWREYRRVWGGNPPRGTNPRPPAGT